jgi:hypothetical protein
LKHEAGELSELFGSSRKEQSETLWPQICHHARTRKPFDDEGARRMALACFKSMTGRWPAHEFERTKPLPLSPVVAGKLKQMEIAWRKGRKAASV